MGCILNIGYVAKLVVAQDLKIYHYVAELVDAQVFVCNLPYNGNAQFLILLVYYHSTIK